MDTLEQAKKELLSYNSGEPIIVTYSKEDGGFTIYNIVMFLRTVTNCKPEYINSVKLKLLLPNQYPNESPEVALNKTVLFHPNFSANGFWQSNSIVDSEGISDYLMRLVRTLQFKEIDANSVANRNAMAWYNKYKQTGVFPTDKVNYYARPRISILKVNIQ